MNSLDFHWCLNLNILPCHHYEFFQILLVVGVLNNCLRDVRGIPSLSIPIDLLTDPGLKSHSITFPCSE
jgi:hypothetical protein